MKIKSKHYLLCLFAPLIIGTLFNTDSSTPVKATSNPNLPAESRPTNINVTDQDGNFLSSYYSAINGKSGDQLLSALNAIIDDHREYNYENTTDRLIYKIIDRNWTLSPLSPTELQNFNYDLDNVIENPFIRKLYADYNDSALTADRFKNEDASRVSFDKEHIWAQSLGDFGRDVGAGSDFHSLLPSDISANQNAHSNYNFATPTISITDYNNDYGTYVGRNGYITGFAEKVFEPLDQYKGDIARAMFYMPARYYEHDESSFGTSKNDTFYTHPKLSLVNGSPSATTSSSTNPGLAGDLATLLEWHHLDPVDEYEIHRNNLIYNNYQGNRNPFIDYPQLADIAYDSSYSGAGASISSADACLTTGCPYYEQSESNLVSISITNPADQMDYYIGATLDTSGLEVRAYYSDNTSVPISGYTLSIQGESGLTLTSSGMKTVTVTYEANATIKTTSYTIYVASDTTLIANPTITSVPIGSNYSDTNLTANLVYSTINGSFDVEIPYGELTVSHVDTMILGTQEIAVSYLDYQGQFDFVVTNEDAEILSGESTSDLFISEYIEGGSSNKSIEIYNGNNSSVNLSDYSISLFSNGNTEASSTLTFIDESIMAQDVYVISNSSSVQDILSVTDKTSGVANFNGNDALILYKGETIIDVIGTVGSDANFALNMTMTRNQNVSSGNTTYTPSEWSTYPQDTFDYLGFHTVSWPTTGVSASQQAEAYANYFLNVTGPYCEDGEGNLIPWLSLKDEYLFMDSSSKDIFVSSSDPSVVNARQRYTLLINRGYGFDNYLVDGSGTPLISQKRLTTTSSREPLLIISLIVISLIVVSGYIIYRKRQLDL